MDTTLILELHIFLTSIYGGLIAGSVYDIYRTIRYYSRPSKFISYLGDLVFWTIITSIFFYILIKINCGEIRGYIIFGFFIGVVTYTKIFSRFIYPVLIRIGGVLSKVVIGIVTVVLYPVKLFKRKSLPTLKKAKKIPIEIIREIKKYKKIISTKK